VREKDFFDRAVLEIVKTLLSAKPDLASAILVARSLQITRELVVLRRELFAAQPEEEE
jgi:hypothetical protein